MKQEDDWNSIDRARASLGRASMGLLRLTLLFGFAAIALALLAIPLLDRDASGDFMASSGSRIDFTTTGSIGSGPATYTIRRSVLQKSPDAVCVIRQDGSRSGDC